MTVLRPLSLEELNNIFNDKSLSVLEYFIKKSIFSQPERMEWQDKLPIQIPKEHIEQWLVQALNVKWIWAWSYPVDLINEKENWWADVKMVSAWVNKNWELTNKDSWETSLAQKFVETWNDLDNLFKNWDYEIIKDKWLWIYQDKLEEVIEKENFKNVYYFILIRWWDKLFLAWMEVVLDNLKHTEVDLERTTDKSVFVDWFLEERYWYTKIYKSKKRLELRLKPKVWNEENLCLVFTLANYIENGSNNLLDFIEKWWSLNSHWIENAKKLFNS